MAGAPTLYKEIYNDQAFKLCLLGATDSELADFFDIAESTLNLWKTKHPEFVESIRAGKVAADLKIAGALYDGAMDRLIPTQQAVKVKSVYWDENGKRCEKETVEVVEVMQGVPGDFRNQRFWLMNRQKDKWRDKQEQTISFGETVDPDLMQQLADKFNLNAKPATGS